MITPLPPQETNNQALCQTRRTPKKTHIQQTNTTRSWWDKSKEPPSPADFHAHAAKEMKAWVDCAAARGEAACVRLYQPQQLVKGMYAAFLAVSDWMMMTMMMLLCAWLLLLDCACVLLRAPLFLQTNTQL